MTPTNLRNLRLAWAALLIFIGVCVSCLDADTAAAESFDVRARIFCPASLVLDTAGNPVAVDADFNDSSVHWVPCSGVYVRVMDADDDWDDVCAAGYTDSRGVLSVRASCGDTTNRPDVYLDVQGRSALSFSVGTWDYGFWDFLETLIVDVGGAIATNGWSIVIGLADGADFPDEVIAHETAHWLTEERLGTDNVPLDFGDRALGDDFTAVAGTSGATTQDASLWAARELWIVNRSLQQIYLGSTRRPFFFKWTVDHPLFGAPSTLWDTIIVDHARMESPGLRSRALQATPHEIGHVIHNRYHSNYSHWIYSDALEYARVHVQCSDPVTRVLGWYEGFANTIEDYVYSASDISGSLSPAESHENVSGSASQRWEPFAGCRKDSNDPAWNTAVVRGDFVREGNNQAVLNRIYYGPLYETLDLATTPTAEEYVCPQGFASDLRGDTWWCTRVRPSLCNATADRRVIDANGAWLDLCEEDPEITLPWTTSTGLEPSVGCVGDPCIDLASPGISVTPPASGTGASGSSSTTVTVQPTHDADGNPIEPEDGAILTGFTPQTPPDLSQVDTSGLIPSAATSDPNAVRVTTADCSAWSDPTGSMTRVVVAGLDECHEESLALFSPPSNPSAANDVRIDGWSRSVIAPNESGTREWFGLPELGDIVGFVSDSGSGAHRMQEHWDASIEAFCLGRDPWGRRWFCHPFASPAFRSELANIGLIDFGSSTGGSGNDESGASGGSGPPDEEVGPGQHRR